MSEQKPKLLLTSPQKRFLASYIDDIVNFDDASLRDATRDEFVKRVSGMDFDGTDSAANCRVARHLKNKGLLTELDLHRDAIGQDCIYLIFSAAGAEAIYDVMKENDAASAGLQKYAFVYADRTENRVTGEIDAENAAQAAVRIMGQTGVGEQPRHSRYSPAVKEERLMWAGNGELITFKRDNVFFLEVKKVGTRKRKPLEFTA